MQLKEERPITVLTVGTWDIPHLGHFNFLKKLKGLFPNSRLVVGVNRDDFIYRFKHRLPVFSYEERSTLVGLINFVDSVLPNAGDEDSKVLIEQVLPEVLAIGSDWAKKDYYTQMGFDQDWLDAKNISLIYIPYTPMVSTTEIKRRLRDDGSNN